MQGAWPMTGATPQKKMVATVCQANHDHQCGHRICSYLMTLLWLASSYEDVPIKLSAVRPRRTHNRYKWWYEITPNEKGER